MPAKDKPKLIILLGATATGKTDVALQVVQSWRGEIISADSMQVYRHMDIGTAKPSPQQRSQVPHHLIDVVNPNEVFNAALFIEHARGIVVRLQQQGRPVFVVGGTGLYIKALLGGLFDGPGPDEGLRAHYKETLHRHGKAHLYALLRERDEKAARIIRVSDAARIIRALEVWDLCGRSIVDLQQGHRFADREYEALKIGLEMERKPLYHRIDARAEAMVRGGLVEEVQNLMAMGYGEELKPMQSLGYKHMVPHVKGRCSLDEALSLMQRDTRNYAKRQMTWFRADEDITWFHPQDIDPVQETIRRFLSP